MKYYKICRIRCKCCGDILEYTNRSKLDNGPRAPMICRCGRVGLDPSALAYRVLAFQGGTIEDNIEDLSEEWIDPCPFCGSEDCKVTDVDDILKTNWVECNSCGTFGPTGATEAEAIEKWNRRL